jgi:16S rRNA (uracil1498-N3)-methyltransferase
MTVPRVYLESAPPGKKIFLEDAAARRLLRVLRVTKGSEIVLFGWGPEEAIAQVSETGRDFIIATIVEVRKRQRPAPEITLIASLLKHQQMDAVIENSAMMGVSRFVPVVTERTISRVEPDKIGRKVERWNDIARNASALACITPPMKVEPPVSLMEGFLRARGPSILLYESAERLLSDFLSQNPPGEEITLLMGPEGGWSESEVENLREHGAIPALLGPYILRPSVAAVVAITLIHAAKRADAPSNDERAQTIARIAQ